MSSSTALIAAILAAVVPGTTAAVTQQEPSHAERPSATADALAAPDALDAVIVASDAATTDGLTVDALSAGLSSADGVQVAGAQPAVGAEVLAPDAAAAPAATGVYQWMCLLSDGRQYFLPAGEPVTNCKGTYLAKYLDGNRLASYRLSAAGEVIAPWDGDLQNCLLAVATVGTGTAALVLSPPTGAAIWFSAASAGLGVLSLGACVG